VNRQKIAVLSIAILALMAFAAAAYLYTRPANDGSLAPVQSLTALERPHSPVIGPADAKVTIVEFFDPSCEACRAFYPIVKQIMAKYPKDVRLVLRYAPFHQGSDEAVRILETARLQNVFEPVLEALLNSQPEWASHDGPQLVVAWVAAGKAGLDIERAKAAMFSADITAVLNQDVNDAREIGVTRTPAFFVNGKPLKSFGAQQLYDLVSVEVGATR